MNIPVLEDRITLKSKREVLKLFLYTKFLENGIKSSDTELEVLMELYMLGGFYNHTEEETFFSRCIEFKYRQSLQSIRNVLTRFTNLGVVKKPKIHQRFISKEYLPKIDSPIIGLNFFVSNDN